MLIVISLENIENMFFMTKYSYVDFKNGVKGHQVQLSEHFYKLCFFFFSGPTTRCFLNSKNGRGLSEDLN